MHFCLFMLTINNVTYYNHWSVDTVLVLPQYSQCGGAYGPVGAPVEAGVRPGSAACVGRPLSRDEEWGPYGWCCAAGVEPVSVRCVRGAGGPSDCPRTCSGSGCPSSSTSTKSPRQEHISTTVLSSLCQLCLTHVPLEFSPSSTKWLSCVFIVVDHFGTKNVIILVFWPFALKTNLKKKNWGKKS